MKRQDMRIVHLEGIYQVQYRLPRFAAWIFGRAWAPCVHYSGGPEASFTSLEAARKFKAEVELRHGGGEVVT